MTVQQQQHQQSRSTHVKPIPGTTLTGLGTLSRVLILGYWRDRAALFFTILFPLIFLVLIGGLFNSDTVPRSKVQVVGTVEVLDALPADRRAEIGQVLVIEPARSRDAALELVRRGDIAAVIEQRGQEVVVHYSAADTTSAGTVRSVIEALVQGFNQATAPAPPSSFTVTSQTVEDASISRIQYLTPGILAWAIAAAATFAAASTLVVWRQRGTLRRLTLSPVGVTAVIGARIGVSLIVALVQTALFLTVAVLFFGLQLTGSWWLSIPLVLVGTMTFLAIGLLAGALARSVETASVAANIVVIPMAFLSGSFFPLNIAPPWLANVAEFLPLYHLNTGMLDVMARGRSFTAVLPQIGILAAFAVVISAVAIWRFRWEDG